MRLNARRNPLYHGLREGDKKLSYGCFAFQIKSREDRFRAKSMYHPDALAVSYGAWCAYHLKVLPEDKDKYAATVVGYGETLTECAFNAGQGVLRKIHKWQRPDVYQG